MSIARNIHKRRGRPITQQEVWACAKPNHPACNGRGYVEMVVAAPAGLAGTPRKLTCACATKRFLAANPHLITDDEGHGWWPAEKFRGNCVVYQIKCPAPTTLARSR